MSRPGGRRRIAVRTAVVALFLLLPACDDGAPGPPKPATENQRQYEGLSREEIEQQAEPMTLEQAESLGITVDTTIGIQAPLGPDSVLLPEGIAVP